MARHFRKTTLSGKIRFETMRGYLSKEGHGKSLLRFFPAQLRQKQRRAHSSIFWSLSKCTSMLLQKVTQVNRVVLPVCCTRRPASHHATSTASLPTRTSRLVTQSMESLQTRVRRIPPRSGFAFASTWGGCCRLPPLLQNPTLAFFFLSSPLYIFTNLLRKKSCFRKRN